MIARPKRFSVRVAAATIATLALVAVSLLSAAPASAATGDYTQYTALGASVRNVGLGPDGNPWFTDNGGGEIGYVDVNSGDTFTFGTPGYIDLTGITEGPDGNMWFIADGNTVGHQGTFLVRFDLTTHLLTQFQVPTGNAVDGVASAAGKLWVTEGTAPAIASFDPTTTAWNEYAVPGGDPDALAVAPDGLLWFAMYNGHTVGSLDPTAADPESTVTIATGQPVNGGALSLTVAPDGVVWVAEANNNRVDSYNPTTATWTTGQNLTGVPDGDVFDITAAPNGTIWLSLITYDGMAAIDPTTGDPTLYKLPATFGFQESSGIVVGSDNNIWTGAYFGKSMFRFEAPHPAVVTTTTLASGKVNVPYSQTIVATGTPPITFAVTAGSLPAGLTLDPATGVISGTPTTAGTSTFTIIATGADGPSDPPFTIVIDPTLAATGIDPTPGLTLGGLLLLIGAAVLIVRRRRQLLAKS